MTRVHLGTVATAQATGPRAPGQCPLHISQQAGMIWGWKSHFKIPLCSTCSFRVPPMESLPPRSLRQPYLLPGCLQDPRSITLWGNTKGVWSCKVSSAPSPPGWRTQTEHGEEGRQREQDPGSLWSWGDPDTGPTQLPLLLSPLCACPCSPVQALPRRRPQQQGGGS